MFLTEQKEAAGKISSLLPLSALKLRVKQTFWADSLEEEEKKLGNVIIDRTCCVGLLLCQPEAYFQTPENTQEIINDYLVIILIAY